MDKPKISENFTIDDIHKLREYNHAVTKDMTFDERKKYYENGADRFKRKLKHKPELVHK